MPERRVSCPYCGEAIVIVVDASAGSATYVEDCQVCCQPMQVCTEVVAGELVSVTVGR